MDPTDKIMEIIHEGAPDTLSRIAAALGIKEAPVAAQPSVPDAVFLGCARMGLAEASDEEVLNYVRIATKRAAAPTPPAADQAQQATAAVAFVHEIAMGAYKPEEIDARAIEISKMARLEARQGGQQ